MIVGEKKLEKTEEKLLVASQWQLFRWKFLRHKLAVSSLIILIFLYFCALFADFIAPYNPSGFDKLRKFYPPQTIRFVDNRGNFSLRPFVYGLKSDEKKTLLFKGWIEDRTQKHYLHFWVRGDSYKIFGIEFDLHLFGFKESKVMLFGADRLGRDLFSRILHGARISLTVGLVGVAIIFILGITIGGISGYFGGTIDKVIQRIIEFIRSIPTLPLWMALSASLPPTWSITTVYFGIVIILSFMGWTGLARVVRGKFMALREEDFVMAARIHGAGKTRIIFKHMLPSFYSYIIASLTLSIPGMILGETALSFIGLGLQEPAVSWGVLLSDAKKIMVLAKVPWLLIPGIFIIITILAFNFVGDGVRDAADPYSNI